MFKSKKETKPVVPNKPPEMTEAQRVIARGERVKALSGELTMWRGFAAGCRPGRHIYESPSLSMAHYAMSNGLVHYEATLSATMDEDTAPMWAAFAGQMADRCERRLKDVLG